MSILLFIWSPSSKTELVYLVFILIQIGIVITDGLSHNPAETAIEAEKTREAGVHLFAVGVGKNRDVKELESIASRPLDYYLFQVESFRHLESIRDLLAIKTCQGWYGLGYIAVYIHWLLKVQTHIFISFRHKRDYHV